MTTLNPIQALLDKLRNEFIAELPGRIEEIEKLILTLDSADNYEELYRHIHSLKGAGGTHGIQIISVICHNLETYLQTRKDSGDLNSTACIDHCLKYIDLLNKTYKESTNSKNQLNRIEAKLGELTELESAHKYTALVLESSNLHINLIKQSLSSLSLAIETHDNGLKALELLLHKKYDLIITGMEINELNGEALISAVRLSKAINKNTKCILLTTRKPAKPNRMTDPDRIISRSTDLSTQLLETTKELLKEIN
ncbi:MAG: Hpt domain-containing protein [Gammaproteobacteria bacterium]|nr:Hpt domain-containing protein [Gammaproteobacteria bacterium]